MIVIKRTSEATPVYNCIAWAAEDNTQWWEPDPFGIYYWPETIERKYSINTYVEAYKSIGYQNCSDEIMEPKFKKVAIYADSMNMPTHAARQLVSGNWTSKLGIDIDVEHSFVNTWGNAILQMNPINLAGYGKLVALLRKPF